jgi:hypothetical protein
LLLAELKISLRIIVTLGGKEMSRFDLFAEGFYAELLDLIAFSRDRPILSPNANLRLINAGEHFLLLDQHLDDLFEDESYVDLTFFFLHVYRPLVGVVSSLNYRTFQRARHRCAKYVKNSYVLRRHAYLSAGL